MKTFIKVINKVKEGFLKDIFNETIWIYQLIKRYSMKVVMYTVLSLISLAITMFVTVKIGDIVDSLVSSNLRSIIRAGSLYVIFGLINVIINMIIQRVSCTINLNVKTEIRIEVFDKIMIADWEELKNYHSGDLLSRINDDVNNVSESIIGWIPTFIIKGCQLVVTLAMIVYYDYSLVLVILICIPIVLIGSRIFLPKMYDKNKMMREIDSEVMSFDKEAFHNIQSIKSFGVVKEFCYKMRELQKKYININLEYNKYSILSSGIMYVSGQLSAMICLGFVIYHVHIGRISIGTMALFIMLAKYASEAFQSLSDLVPKVISTIASSGRLRKLINLTNEENDTIDIKELRREVNQEGAIIKVENMSFTYKNGINVFEDVSIEAKSGEIIALVGPSGEGKTTMLRILLGLIKVTNGEAYITSRKGNFNKVNISPSTRKLIAYVPQGNTMMAGTIADNMRIINKYATDEEIIEALKKACAYDFVSSLPDNINHKIGESGIGFSEGQNQRLSIARALLSDAPILLLDEATSALDVATERKIINNIMVHDEKHICILTTHRPTVLSLCDRVYKISNKKIKVIDDEEVSELIEEF
ncbi:ABC transporter ATP-binding protein/permease [Clostridium sp. MSJ-8]|uniref:ABC transporter ATP-binding protein n=1 Tax=Clostridium sp. MSJ-8 TaxID=2841510 RepID=UPI001C0EB8B2|nr:ABC transporter ATP-binding protein [Clostridium sp. MSJ-8]MBU5488903.1 ABC transporter ATP-binding protein/permease [Clostridium sp. MSJ-8]